jgi:tripartite-type tricarboxylate transporter receptor subunit TctC
VRSRLSTLIANALHEQSTRELFASVGLDTFATTPEELASFQAAESRKWAAVIKNANIQPE